MVIFLDVCLCRGAYFTRNIEFQYPSPPWCQVQGGVNLTVTKSGGWGSDVTASVVAGIKTPEARDPEARGTGS